MEGTRQEYIVLISDNFPINQKKLQEELQGMLTAQNDEDYEEFFNSSFSLVVARVHECMSKTTISNAAARMHDESSFDITTWSKRGPGWYRDRWLSIVVDEIVAEWSEEEEDEVTPEDNELMALHKKITTLEKELGKKSEEVKKLEKLRDKSVDKERADRLQLQLDRSYDTNVSLQESLDATESALKERTESLQLTIEQNRKAIAGLQDELKKTKSLLDEKEADIESLQYLVKEYEIAEEESLLAPSAPQPPKNGSYTKRLETALDFLGFDNVLASIQHKEGIIEK